MKHGTTYCYQHHRCRCVDCRLAIRDYWRDYYDRQRNGPPEPDDVAVDRACNGDRSVPLTRWEMAAALTRLDVPPRSLNEIADILGVTQRTVVRWRTGRTTLPHARPARKDAA